MKTEKVFGAILLTGLTFRFMHWPFAGPLLVVGIGILGILYLAGSFYFFSDETIKRQNLVLSIISGFFLMNACNGILFKLMFWPFSGPLLMIAATTVPVLLIITFVLRSTAATELMTYYNNMIIRLSIISFIATVLFFTPTTTLVKIIHRDDPERVRLQTRSMMNPENEEYSKEFNDYLDQKHSREEQPAQNGN